MTKLFMWDANKFETQVTEMDNEHLKLIEIMNQLITKNNQQASRKELLNTVDQLSEWTKTHFEHEEIFLEKINYSNIENHKNIHKRLLSQLHQHKTDFANSSAKQINERFFDFLNLWLTAHIQHIDMQYSIKKNKKAG